MGGFVALDRARACLGRAMVVPLGAERYLYDASRWSISFVLVLPIAPLGS